MNISSMLLNSANLYPDKVCIRFKKEAFTYSDIRDKAKAMAAGLAGLCYSEKCRTGILLSNRPEFVISFFAIALCSGISFLFDVNYTVHELKQIITDCQVNIIVTTSSKLQDIQKIKEETGIPEYIILVDSEDKKETLCYNRLLVHGEGSNDWGKDIEENSISVSEENATCQYTSGVSGYPKIIFRNHNNLYQEVKNFTERIKYSPEDNVLCIPPLNHAYALMVGLVSPIYSGSEITLCEKFIPGTVLKRIKESRITTFVGVPFQYDLLCETFLDSTPDISSIRAALSAGAPLSKNVREKFWQRFKVNINQLYGLTETGALAVNLTEHAPQSVGKPLPNVEILIFDDDHKELPHDHEGEIAVKSLSAANEYFRQPSLSSKAFNEGLFFTGDIGKKDEEGNLFIIGKKKNIINVAGKKVDPVEIEDILMAHPAVKEAVVVGAKGESTGEIIKAVLVVNEKIIPEEIQKFCRIKLASYKIPTIVEVTEQLPRSTTGKILRKYFL
ncbi:MAG: class I adenylate-forming enzyme family protein [Thermodesulfobacteriota bacterium]|nr:class I adenylate-forming enzyme family protein [Thermodesulfobacteriota bacterium]